MTDLQHNVRRMVRCCSLVTGRVKMSRQKSDDTGHCQRCRSTDEEESVRSPDMTMLSLLGRLPL